MGEFFGSIYCFLFEDFFGLDLANYLWGISTPESTSNQFILFGSIMLAVSLLVAVVYYKIIDHPRLAHWWCWALFMALNAVINFFIGWGILLNQYYAGKMTVLDPITGTDVPLANIGQTNILCFGLTNMFLSIIAFFIFSMCLRNKWVSNNCSQSPFIR